MQTTPIDCPTTEEDLAEYQERGFIQYPEFFSEQEIDELREALDLAVSLNRARIKGQEDGGRHGRDYELVFNQMVNLWTDYAGARKIALNKRLAECARRLSQARNVRIYHDHALIKPPGAESRETNWHQDFPYWVGMDRPGALSAWVAVDNVTVENGCMHFVPGSHKLGKQEPIKLSVQGESIVEKMKAQGYEVAEPEVIALPAGGVTFHHGCNFHHAGANLGDSPRRAFAIIYIPDYVLYTGKADAAGAVDEMEPGKPWDHPLHPVLAEGNEEVMG